MSLIYLVPMIGVLFLGMGIYIFTVNPNGPADFPIGPLIAENNNTLIQHRTGIDMNLSWDYAFGVISLVSGSLFTSILPVMWLYDKYSGWKKEKP